MNLSIFITKIIVAIGELLTDVIQNKRKFH